MALLKLIIEHQIFKRPVILTRGYGGSLKGPVLVDLTQHRVADVGDEALIHAQHAHVIVSKTAPMAQ